MIEAPMDSVLDKDVQKQPKKDNGTISLSELFVSMYPYGFKDARSAAVKIGMEIAMRDLGFLSE